MLSEAHRVLRPGGVLAFSSLCVGTLQELRDSWQAPEQLPFGDQNVIPLRAGETLQWRLA